MAEEILRYFPVITEKQAKMYFVLKEIYSSWNSKINVISRKDFDNFYIHHVLHSLAIAKIVGFGSGTKVLDVGTGGGFPGIPLAILFPEADFFLLDSIEKKIKVVESVTKELGLTNVKPLRKRAEDENGRYDFVVSRAVTDFASFVKLTKKNIMKGDRNNIRNGIICLKGGDLTPELKDFKEKVTIWNIDEFFSEPYFETKKIVYLAC